MRIIKLNQEKGNLSFKISMLFKKTINFLEINRELKLLMEKFKIANFKNLKKFGFVIKDERSHTQENKSNNQGRSNRKNEFNEMNKSFICSKLSIRREFYSKNPKVYNKFVGLLQNNSSDFQGNSNKRREKIIRNIDVNYEV